MIYGCIRYLLVRLLYFYSLVSGITSYVIELKQKGLSNMATNSLDIFRPNKNEPKDCLVLNPDGAAVSILMGQSEAEAFAAKAVAGRIPHLAGIIECYVVRVTPVSRVRDKSIADAEITRVEQ